MKSIRVAACVFAFAIAASSAARADALSDGAGDLGAAIAAMSNCTAIANEIVARKVPPGHARALALEEANAAQTDPTKKIAIDPVHATYRQWMQAEVQKLAACGHAFVPAEAKAEATLTRLDAMKLSDADGTKISAVIDRWHTARETLVAAIGKLSDDRMVQHYVHQALLAEFLK